VEVDTLTGNHRTLRTDVLIDVGSSINPMLDIGQIEGAFTQGMGWSTMEEVVYGDDDHAWVRPTGRTFTTGPGTYKIPSFRLERILCNQRCGSGSSETEYWRRRIF
jgi:xanthine dehydrogenase/oxidase